MYQQTPLNLCYPLNSGRLVFLTCELSVNPLVLCLWTLDCPEVWGSQTQQKRKERAQVEKTLHFGALQRTTALKIVACTETGKFDLPWNATFPPIIQHILCIKTLMKKLPLALFQDLWQIGFSRTNLHLCQWIPALLVELLRYTWGGPAQEGRTKPSTGLVRNSLGMRRSKQEGRTPTRITGFCCFVRSKHHAHSDASSRTNEDTTKFPKAQECSNAQLYRLPWNLQNISAWKSP